MNKKVKKYLLFGVPIAVGLYFVIRQFAGKKTYNDALNNPPAPPPTTTPTTPTPNPNSGNTGSSDNGSGTYKVTTLVSNLNVRERPSLTSSIVGSLPKGTTIWAVPSSTDGWFEYYLNNELIGYVSANYLTRIS